jgi:hypothetical protein
MIAGSDFSAWLAAPHSWYGLNAVVRFLFVKTPLWEWIVLCAAGAVFALQK